MWQTTERKSIFLTWINWHYSFILQEIFWAWKNIFRFNLYYFSIPTLLSTLFSPWRRYNFSYGKRISFSETIENISFNIFSRIVGMIMRILLITFGIFSQILTILFGTVVVFLWVFLPIIITLGLTFSIKWLILI